MDKTLKHNAICYILKNDGRDKNGSPIRKWEAVQEAKPFKNNYNLDLFEINGDLTEGRCGLKMCSVNKFEKTISQYGIDKIEETIRAAIEKYGLSPRYIKPDEIKKEVFNIEDKPETEQAKLMKPLFIDGMFNKKGKRIRAKYVKTLTYDGIDYPLWISAGKPDKNYTKNPKDQYYLMVETNGYLVPMGGTEHELGQRSSYEYLNKSWYGDFEGRNKFFDEIRNGRKYEEFDPLIKEQIAKEEAFIAEHCQDENIQAEFFKKSIVDKHITRYIEARDDKGRYADFHGAAFLNELDKCFKISNKLKAIREQEEAIKKVKREEQRKREEQEEIEAEQKAITETEDIIINGGTIKNGSLICKVADKYNINIPIRTRGWILNALAECTLTADGGISYRYYKKNKNATGSQKVYDVLFDIKKAIQAKVA